MAESPFLDKHLNEVFDWSDSDMPVRDALWDYYMEHNGHDTEATEKAMDPYMEMSADEIKAKAEELLK